MRSHARPPTYKSWIDTTTVISRHHNCEWLSETSRMTESSVFTLSNFRQIKQTWWKEHPPKDVGMKAKKETNFRFGEWIGATCECVLVAGWRLSCKSLLRAMKLHKLGSHPRYSTLEEGSAKVGKCVYMPVNNPGNNWIKQIYMCLHNEVSGKKTKKKNRLTWFS